MTMPSYREILSINEQYALDNGKEGTAIKILLMHFASLKPTELLMNLDQSMDPMMYRRFLYAVDDYIKHNRPIQHITEEEYFYGHRFCVNCDVLIPRYETEELVSHVLDYIESYFGETPIDLVDIGTGSGCIATVLSLENKNVKAVGTDISEKALIVAKKNAESLGADVDFLQGDLLEPVQNRKFDVLVCNPPYIPNDEDVDPLVKDHEPHIALFGGPDGLDFYRVLLKDVETVLKDRYIIAFEHAYHTAKALKKIIKKHLKDVNIVQHKDMQKKDRMTFIFKK